MSVQKGSQNAYFVVIYNLVDYLLLPRYRFRRAEQLPPLWTEVLALSEQEDAWSPASDLVQGRGANILSLSTASPQNTHTFQPTWLATSDPR